MFSLLFLIKLIVYTTRSVLKSIYFVSSLCKNLKFLLNVGKLYFVLFQPHLTNKIKKAYWSLKWYLICAWCKPVISIDVIAFLLSVNCTYKHHGYNNIKQTQKIQPKVREQHDPDHSQSVNSSLANANNLNYYSLIN